MLEWYRRFFSIAEIEQNETLKIVFGVILFSFFLGFQRFALFAITSPRAVTENVHLCWPYFQSCWKFYVLGTFPDAYSQQILSMGIFLLCLLVAVLMYKKEWVLAHVLLLLLWICKAATVFLFSMHFAENYSYYDLYLGSVLLLFPHKLAFLRITFVWLYFLASSVKIDAGWIMGTYFTSLSAGLPIFGNSVAPIFTGVVIFMQMIGSWFLLSSDNRLRLGALVFFATFHLYSGIFVGFRFPSIALTALVVLFAVGYRYSAVPLDRKSVAGWTFLAVLLIPQSIPLLIPGDHRMTLEGNMYGLFMFEANHQCVSNTRTHMRDGSVIADTIESPAAQERCDPYEFWYHIHEACMRHPVIERVEWTFDHSIDGGPFYRIVDTANACVLSYEPFSHNRWIKLPADGPEIIGYPVQNYFANPFSS